MGRGRGGDVGVVFFFQAEDGIRDFCLCRGLGDVCKRQTGGSADKVVHIWDELSAEELYYLPGHKGCINSVVFHPSENCVASGSSDKAIYVGELST